MDNHSCRTCHQPFDSWDELAEHIRKQCKIKDNPHKKDRAGLKWAKLYQHRNAINKMRKLGKEFPQRNPLTAEQRQSKQDSIRLISKKKEMVKTYCPKGKHFVNQLVEREYVESPHAVRTQQGILEMLCDGCRTK